VQAGGIRAIEAEHFVFGNEQGAAVAGQRGVRVEGDEGVGPSLPPVSSMKTITRSFNWAAAPKALKKELRAMGLIENPFNANGAIAVVRPAVWRNFLLFIFIKFVVRQRAGEVYAN